MIKSPYPGGCSSMAERLTVDQDVEGSKPFSHPGMSEKVSGVCPKPFFNVLPGRD